MQHLARLDASGPEALDTVQGMVEDVEMPSGED
jgi:hypothetical protein